MVFCVVFLRRSVSCGAGVLVWVIGGWGRGERGGGRSRGGGGDSGGGGLGG